MIFHLHKFIIKDIEQRPLATEIDKKYYSTVYLIDMKCKCGKKKQKLYDFMILPDGDTQLSRHTTIPWERLGEKE